MRGGQGDIVPEGFYDPPESDDLELIQSEYDKLYTLAQEMAEALEREARYQAVTAALIDDRNPNGELSEITHSMRVAKLRLEKALTKWAGFKK